MYANLFNTLTLLFFFYFIITLFKALKAAVIVAGARFSPVRLQIVYSSYLLDGVEPRFNQRKCQETSTTLLHIYNSIEVVDTPLVSLLIRCNMLYK